MKKNYQNQAAKSIYGLGLVAAFIIMVAGVILFIIQLVAAVNEYEGDTLTPFINFITWVAVGYGVYLFTWAVAELLENTYLSSLTAERTEQLLKKLLEKENKANNINKESVPEKKATEPRKEEDVIVPAVVAEEKPAEEIKEEPAIDPTPKEPEPEENTKIQEESKAEEPHPNEPTIIKKEQTPEKPVEAKKQEEEIKKEEPIIAPASKEPEPVKAEIQEETKPEEPEEVIEEDPNVIHIGNITVRKAEDTITFHDEIEGTDYTKPISDIKSAELVKTKFNYFIDVVVTRGEKYLSIKKTIAHIDGINNKLKSLIEK